MSKEYTRLETQALARCSGYQTPLESSEVVYLDDPATYVMTDFQHVKPLVINKEARMYDARRQMEEQHLPVTLVTDETQCLIGIISLEDILGTRPVKLQEEFRIERKELKVKHLMTKLEDLISVDFATLETAQVGHVISTLQSLEQHYLLVSEAKAEDCTIRGLLVDSQISRQLGVNIRQPASHLSIADLQRLLHH